MGKREHLIAYHILHACLWMTNDYLELKALVGPWVLGCAALYSLCSDSWQRKKLTWQKPALHKKKVVNNRNSIKLPWFPVSYALWTAWSDRGWLAERLVGCRSAPTTAHSTLSWLRCTTLICTSSEWGFVFYSGGLKKEKKKCLMLQWFAKVSTEPQTQVRLMQHKDLSYPVLAFQKTHEMIKNRTFLGKAIRSMMSGK